MVIVVADHESDIRFVIFDRLTKILPTFTKIEKMHFYLLVPLLGIARANHFPAVLAPTLGESHCATYL
jgi:hypothetical protein